MSNTKKLAFSGVMLALATILSFIPLFKMPFGGTVTLASMLPIVLVAYRYGTGWGVLTGFVYGLIQLVQGAVTGDMKGLSIGVVIGASILDYIAAYSLLGLAGVFGKKIKNNALSFGLGTLIACFSRFIAHAVSGYLFFSQWAEWYFSQEGFKFGESILAQYAGTKLYLIYTVVYNGTYMLPETVLTVALAVVLALGLKKYIQPERT